MSDEKKLHPTVTDEFGISSLSTDMEDPKVTKVVATYKGLKAEVDIKVILTPLQSITLSHTDIQLPIPSLNPTPSVNFVVKATLKPENASHLTLTWIVPKELTYSISEDTKNITITDGKPGRYEITCKNSEGITAKLMVSFYDITVASTTLWANATTDMKFSLTTVSPTAIPIWFSRPLIGSPQVVFSNPTWDVKGYTATCTIPATVGEITEVEKIEFDCDFNAYADKEASEVYTIQFTYDSTLNGDGGNGVIISPVYPKDIVVLPNENGNPFNSKNQVFLPCDSVGLPINVFVFPLNVTDPSVRWEIPDTLTYEYTDTGIIVHTTDEVAESKIKCITGEGDKTFTKVFTVFSYKCKTQYPSSILVNEKKTVGFIIECKTDTKELSSYINVMAISEYRYLDVEYTAANQKFLLTGRRDGEDVINTEFRVPRYVGSLDFDVSNVKDLITVHPSYEMTLTSNLKTAKLGDVVEVYAYVTINGQPSDGLALELITVPGGIFYAATTTNGKVTFKYRVTKDHFRFGMIPTVGVVSTDFNKKVDLRYVQPKFGFGINKSNFGFSNFTIQTRDYKK